MLTAYLGRPISQQHLARLFDTQDFGTPASRIRRLDQLGFSVIYESGSVPLLWHQIESGVPCIVFVWTGDLPYWSVSTPHAIVVIAITDDAVWVNDPAFDAAPQKVPLGDFELAWSEFDYRCAVIMRSGGKEL